MELTWSTTHVEMNESLPCTERGRSIVCRALNYKSDSIAGLDDEEYVGHFYNDSIPEDEKLANEEGVKEYMMRVLPIAPNVIEWVDEHAQLRSDDDDDLAYSIFETFFACYLMDWYFMELGRFLLEKDSEED